MIIFDLDGTLADCEHRRHFVERNHPVNEKKRLSEISLEPGGEPNYNQWVWKPDWESFYETCGEDKPILPVWKMFTDRLDMGLKKDIQIWSARCESVRKKTETWLKLNISPSGECDLPILKMRPIGDTTPDDQLKEKWLDEALAVGKKIDFVFDSDPNSIKMWQRRGIFVFNVSQGKGDY